MPCLAGHRTSTLRLGKPASPHYNVFLLSTGTPAHPLPARANMKKPWPDGSGTTRTAFKEGPAKTLSDFVGSSRSTASRCRDGCDAPVLSLWEVLAKEGRGLRATQRVLPQHPTGSS